MKCFKQLVESRKMKRTATLGALRLRAIAEVRRHMNLGVLANLHRQCTDRPTLNQVLAGRELEWAWEKYEKDAIEYKLRVAF